MAAEGALRAVADRTARPRGFLLGVLVGLLLAPAPALSQQDSVAPTVEWERAAPGDTVIVPDSLIVFFIDRPELNRLRVNQRNDSVKIAQQDSALGDYAEAVDSLEGALTGCKQRARGLMIQRDWKDTVITAERDARKALEEAQQGSLFRGPSGFLMGTGAGLTAGVLACRGAN